MSKKTISDFIARLLNRFLKRCSWCRLIKFKIGFNKHKSRPDGLQIHCKRCMKNYVAEWQKRNREKTRMYANKYNHEHPIKKKTIANLRGLVILRVKRQESHGREKAIKM